jgi:integrase
VHLDGWFKQGLYAGDLTDGYWVSLNSGRLELRCQATCLARQPRVGIREVALRALSGNRRDRPPCPAVHDLRHTYASLARRAGADLRLLQKTMGHASITVTAHIYADLYDDELDDIASALDTLDDLPTNRA